MKVIRIDHDGCTFYIPSDADTDVVSIMQPIECPLCGKQVTGDFAVIELELPTDFNWLEFA